MLFTDVNPAHMEESAECWALWATPRKLLLLALNFKLSQIHVLKLKHMLYCMHNIGPQCSANIMSVPYLVFMLVHGNGLRSWKCRSCFLCDDALPCGQCPALKQLGFHLFLFFFKYSREPSRVSSRDYLVRTLILLSHHG